MILNAFLQPSQVHHPVDIRWNDT